MHRAHDMPPLSELTPHVPAPTQASTMQPQHVIAALKELEFTELAEEIEAHQREWEAGERPKGARPGFSPHACCAWGLQRMAN